MAGISRGDFKQRPLANTSRETTAVEPGEGESGWARQRATPSDHHRGQRGVVCHTRGLPTLNKTLSQVQRRLRILYSQLRIQVLTLI